VAFVVAELGPDVDPFILHLFAARTKAALSAAKARGLALGNPRLSKARKSAVASIKALADQHAANVVARRGDENANGGPAWVLLPMKGYRRFD
jgi:hypothetical protein